MEEKDAPFSNREIKLLFKNLEDKLDTFMKTIETSSENFDRRLMKVEEDVRNLTTFQTRAMTIWGILVTALSFAVTKLF